MALHGTRARYIVHIRAKEDPCEACKAANTRTQREYLDANPVVLEREQRKKRAVSRAGTRLRSMFPVEWEALYQEELKKKND